METHRVKILTASFDEDKDMVTWHVLFLDTNEDRTLCWPAPDLGVALGIKNAIPSELMHDFCEKMYEKELNLAIEGEPAPVKIDIDAEVKAKTDQVADTISGTLFEAANKMMDNDDGRR